MQIKNKMKLRWEAEEFEVEDLKVSKKKNKFFYAAEDALA